MFPDRTLCPIVLLTCAACGTGGTAGGSLDQNDPSRSVFRAAGTLPVEVYTEPGRAEQAFVGPKLDIWRAVARAYDALEMPLDVIDPEQLEIGTGSLRASRIEGKRMASYVDCGTSHSGRLANLYQVTLTVLSRLNESEDGFLVTTTLRAFGQARTVSSNPVPCRSTGVLEERINQLAAEMLAAG